MTGNDIVAEWLRNMRPGGKTLAAIVDEAFAEIRRTVQKEGSEWQPITTAPKNGQPLILWDDYWLMRIGVWDIRRQCWAVDQPCVEEGQGQMLNPIKWMYTPSVPKR